MKVLIDPGHDPSCVNGGRFGYKEHEGMWRLSNYLKKELETYGHIVNLTRNYEQEIALTQRGRQAAGYDVFISEHSNASNGTVRGVEVYYSVDIPEDEKIATKLSRATALVMQNADRGAKVKAANGEDHYTVIDSAQDCGCKHVFLIENGFHDNEKDEKFLLDNKNLIEIAKKQAEIIHEIEAAELLINYSAGDVIIDAEMVNNNWYVILPIDDNILKVKLRDVLAALGFNFEWDSKEQRLNAWPFSIRRDM